MDLLKCTSMNKYKNTILNEKKSVMVFKYHLHWYKNKTKCCFWAYIAIASAISNLKTYLVIIKWH